MLAEVYDILSGALKGIKGSKYNSAMTIAETQAHFQEAVLRGQVYSAGAKTATVTATTDISPLPANTGVPIVGVYNPVGSGVRLVMLRAGISTVSGTPGGPFYYNVIPNPCGITAAGLQTAVNHLSGLAAGSRARWFNHSAITGSVVATEIRAFGGPAAVAAGAGLYHQDDLLDGAFIIEPGAFFGLAAHAVGTSHVVSAYLTWEEQPIA